VHAPYHTPAGTPMFSELAGYEAQIAGINREVQSLTAGLTDEQFNWRPAVNRWSIAENLEHLTAFGRQYLPALDDAIAVGRSRSIYGEGPFRYGILDRLFAWAMEPPVRVPFKTARAVTPEGGQPVAGAVRAFLAVQEELRARVGQANGLDLVRVKVRSPFISQLAPSLGKMLGALLAHERRHLWQARRVREAPGFPNTREPGTARADPSLRSG
jgi:hypothetical protein